MKFSVKHHKEPGETTSTHSVLLFLVPYIPLCFHRIACHQQLSNLLVWPPCWPNQSRNMPFGTHITQRWGFWILDSTGWVHVGFIVRLPVVFTVIWIVQVPIPVKPIFSIRIALRCTFLITFSWMSLNCFYSMDIYNLSWSSREVLCTQSWWHMWSFRQFKCNPPSCS